MSDDFFERFGPQKEDWIADCLEYRGVVLTGEKAHWCSEWDGLPIDETSLEWPCDCVLYPVLIVYLVTHGPDSNQVLEIFRDINLAKRIYGPEHEWALTEDGEWYNASDNRLIQKWRVKE